MQKIRDIESYSFLLYVLTYPCCFFLDEIVYILIHTKYFICKLIFITQLVFNLDNKCFKMRNAVLIFDSRCLNAKLNTERETNISNLRRNAKLLYIYFMFSVLDIIRLSGFYCKLMVGKLLTSIVIQQGILNPLVLWKQQLDFNLRVMVLLSKKRNAWPAGPHTHAQWMTNRLLNWGVTQCIM